MKYAQEKEPWYKRHQNELIGTGAGSLLGALLAGGATAALSSKENRLRNALIAALVGGGLGGAAGYAGGRYYHDIANWGRNRWQNNVSGASQRLSNWWSNKVVPWWQNLWKKEPQNPTQSPAAEAGEQSTPADTSTEKSSGFSTASDAFIAAKLAADAGVPANTVLAVARTTGLPVVTVARYVYKTAAANLIADRASRVLAKAQQRAKTASTSYAPVSAPQIMNQYLDRLAHGAPYEKQAAIRNIQAQLAAGKTLSAALRSTFPRTTPEKRGMLAMKLAQGAAEMFSQAVNSRNIRTAGPKTVVGRPGPKLFSRL